MCSYKMLHTFPFSHKLQRRNINTIFVLIKISLCFDRWGFCKQHPNLLFAACGLHTKHAPISFTVSFHLYFYFLCRNTPSRPGQYKMPNPVLNNRPV